MVGDIVFDSKKERDAFMPDSSEKSAKIILKASACQISAKIQ